MATLCSWYLLPLAHCTCVAGSVCTRTHLVNNSSTSCVMGPSTTKQCWKQDTYHLHNHMMSA